MVKEAPNFSLTFPYKRSVGPVIGAFLTALRDGRLVGVRTASGRVLVPPLEYDPDSGEASGELVEVGEAGTVTGFTWNDQPQAGQPLENPFAWVLVQLDGADTSILHALDVASPTDVQTGMRVRVRWREEREGHLRDIVCFEPEGTS